ncbi:hypothetical protein IQ274_33430 [Nostoc sp. LEGE 12447]|uniref:hypothetical protein n=1 Tax=Nostoc sp. LEGE 12447 TaxID=1828640 RepID=UPI001884486F|nr:hypothetical protein [Nostoc sp. LEGE 12447]MBE9002952.1 hypothetical protein [Nostoc sp. LEGE 12447]
MLILMIVAPAEINNASTETAYPPIIQYLSLQFRLLSILLCSVSERVQEFPDIAITQFWILD